MPGDSLTVAWTGRAEFDGARRLLGHLGVTVIPFGGPADLGVSAAGTHIFTRDEIDACWLGIVNLHLAPLPEFRGRFSATHAILSGAPEYGVTLHYVDEGIDTGPIVAETRWPITDADTAGSLRARARVEGQWLLVRHLPKLLIAAGEGQTLPMRAQDESRARYFDRRSLPVADGSPLLARALAC